jgi:hypothetical protein
MAQPVPLGDIRHGDLDPRCTAILCARGNLSYSPAFGSAGVPHRPSLAGRRGARHDYPGLDQSLDRQRHRLVVRRPVTRRRERELVACLVHRADHRLVLDAELEPQPPPEDSRKSASACNASSDLREGVQFGSSAPSTGSNLERIARLTEDRRRRLQPRHPGHHPPAGRPGSPRPPPRCSLPEPGSRIAEPAELFNQHTRALAHPQVTDPAELAGNGG